MQIVLASSGAGSDEITKGELSERIANRLAEYSRIPRKEEISDPKKKKKKKMFERT